MLHSTVTFLLLAVMLMCPYGCLGGALGAEEPVSGCGCCDEPAPTGEPLPQAPDGQSSDCLCHGAIVGASKAQSTEPTLHVIASVSSWDAAVSSPFPSLNSPHPCHFPPFSTGRNVRVLTCALLL